MIKPNTSTVNAIIRDARATTKGWSGEERETVEREIVEWENGEQETNVTVEWGADTAGGKNVKIVVSWTRERVSVRVSTGTDTVRRVKLSTSARAAEIRKAIVGLMAEVDAAPADVQPVTTLTPATQLDADITVPATMFDPALTYYADGTRVVMRAKGEERYGVCAGKTAGGTVYAFQRVNWDGGGSDNVAPHVLFRAPGIDAATVRGVVVGARVMDTDRDARPMDVTRVYVGRAGSVMASVVFPDGAHDDVLASTLEPVQLDADAAHSDALDGWTPVQPVNGGARLEVGARVFDTLRETHADVLRIRETMRGTSVTSVYRDGATRTTAGTNLFPVQLDADAAHGDALAVDEVPAGMARVASTGEIVQLYVSNPVTDPRIVEFEDEEDADYAAEEERVTDGDVIRIPSMRFTGFVYSGRIFAMSVQDAGFRRADWDNADAEITAEGYAATLATARRLSEPAMGKVVDLKADYQALNKIMEFDHVITVHPDGTVSDGPADVYAPNMEGDPDTGNASLDDSDWSLLSGYTGQQGGGNVMHNSEFIGGGLAEDILSAPGVYVAVACYWPGDDEPEGWGVARLDVTVPEVEPAQCADCGRALDYPADSVKGDPICYPCAEKYGTHGDGCACYSVFLDGERHGNHRVTREDMERIDSEECPRD